MINWDRFALALFSTIMAVVMVTSWTILICAGQVANVPTIFETLLPALVTGGILGAAMIQAGSK